MSTRKSGENPYQDYYVYGPTYNSSIDRYMIFLVKKDRSSRTSMTYARYLMSIHLGRVLGPEEQIDHINNDHKDDRIENLQILSISENNKKSASHKTILLRCPECGKLFTRQKGQTHLVFSRSRTKGVQCTCCCRSCSGKFQVRRKTQDVSQEVANNVVCEYIEPYKGKTRFESQQAHCFDTKS